ncbi:MAG: hypothetical protein IPJ98_24615 [Bryobacterales bacterium]|nr:hypothetical protein [Bryobacterales bacterium]
MGNGPDAPSTLLQETIRGSPGRALDAALGRGRNALYLASQGGRHRLRPLPAALAAKSAASQSGLKLLPRPPRSIRLRHRPMGFDPPPSTTTRTPTTPKLSGLPSTALRPSGLIASSKPPWRRGTHRPQLTRLWRNPNPRYDDLAPGAVMDE